MIVNPALQEDFRYIMKQKGGMLAKGRLLGLQFDALLEDGLYFRLSEHADRLAGKLKAAFLELGWRPLVDSGSNQQFFILPDAALEALARDYAFAYWARVDESHSAARFCTSWATREEDVDRLIADLRRLAATVEKTSGHR